MTRDVRLDDGIAIETETLGTVRCDPREPTGDWNIISHAHGDHLPRSVGDRPIACSALTAQLASVRRDLPEIEPCVPEEIELLDSGHVPGSRAALIRDADHRILFTGDVATRDRYGLDGFSPPSADLLVLEATYGSPEYRFPPMQEIEADVEAWLANNQDRPLVLFAYAFGKAQRVLGLLEGLGVREVLASPAIMEINDALERATGRRYAAEPHEQAGNLSADDVLLLPSQVGRFDWVEGLIEETGALTAGFSGWAADSGYIYQRGFDRGFPLSDHCDFPELIELVETVNPDLTYTHHGFSDELAKELTRRGFEARALQRHQTTLDGF